MPATEAQIRANQQNAAKSTGPRTPEGKEQSRRNSFKHGLTGAGIVLPNEDVAEVEARIAAYRDELKPANAVAETLVQRAALLSVRLDRCVSHETAALRGRIRQAEADFVAPENTDAATVAQLRAEAKALAMFDSSKEASLARRYEAAAERSFYRALKELRQLEKQSEPHDPRAAEAAFEQNLASFIQWRQEDAEMDALFPELNPLASMNLSKRAGATTFPPAEVPMAIGRRR